MIRRHANALLGLIIAISALCFATYLQWFKGLHPCPLCQLQRGCLLCMTLLFLSEISFRPQGYGWWIHRCLLLLFTLLGMGLAARHLYLQSLPADQLPSCVAGLDYLLKTLPLLDVFKMMLQGSAHCAKVHWRFLGLSIPGWSLIVFAVLGIVTCIIKRER